MTFNEGLLELKAPTNFNEDLSPFGNTVTITPFEEELYLLNKKPTQWPLLFSHSSNMF